MPTFEIYVFHELIAMNCSLKTRGMQDKNMFSKYVNDSELPGELGTSGWRCLVCLTPPTIHSIAESTHEKR